MDTKLDSQKKRGRKGLIHDDRGAVLPEFAVVILPMLLCFFCFAQIALVTCAKMAVRHAAGVAVRAAVVSWGVDHQGPGESDDGLALKAAQAALGKWAGSVKIENIAFQYMQESRGNDNPPPFANGEIKVTLTAKYKCGVAMGKRIVCDGGLLEFEEISHMANQGARYKL